MRGILQVIPKQSFKTRWVCHGAHVVLFWKHQGILIPRLLLETCCRTSPFSWWRAASLCLAAIFLPASCELLFQLVSSILPRPLTLHLKEEFGSCCCTISLYTVENGRKICLQQEGLVYDQPHQKGTQTLSSIIKLLFWS